MRGIPASPPPVLRISPKRLTRRRTSHPIRDRCLALALDVLRKLVRPPNVEIDTSRQRPRPTGDVVCVLKRDPRRCAAPWTS
jgi:hypothetical protein